MSPGHGDPLDAGSIGPVDVVTFEKDLNLAIINLWLQL